MQFSKRECIICLKCCDFAKSEINTFLKDLDENGDGEIDFNEFFAWFEKHEF